MNGGELFFQVKGTGNAGLQASIQGLMAVEMGRSCVDTAKSMWEIREAMKRLDAASQTLFALAAPTGQLVRACFLVVGPQPDVIGRLATSNYYHTGKSAYAPRMKSIREQADPVCRLRLERPITDSPHYISTTEITYLPVDIFISSRIPVTVS